MEQKLQGRDFFCCFFVFVGCREKQTVAAFNQQSSVRAGRDRTGSRFNSRQGRPIGVKRHPDPARVQLGRQAEVSPPRLGRRSHHNREINRGSVYKALSGLRHALLVPERESTLLCRSRRNFKFYTLIDFPILIFPPPRVLVPKAIYLNTSALDVLFLF